MKLILHVFQNLERAKEAFKKDAEEIRYICPKINRSQLKYILDYRDEMHWFIPQNMHISYIRGTEPYELRIRDHIDLVKFTQLWGPQLVNLGRTYE